MGYVVIVRGFKLSFTKLDELLIANEMAPLERTRPSPTEEADIAKLLKDMGNDCDIKLIVPSAETYNPSDYLYVCDNWLPVIAARELDGLEETPATPAFQALAKDLQAESDVRRFVLCSMSFDPDMLPRELVQRHTPPIPCGVCTVDFDTWLGRMTHRAEVHGLSEDQNPLPEC
ncbi:hypothetical protein B0J11DRAFT_259730 [Dendryphion nanum]|uniref:C2H2-type domain-containing protein n=1 Tax=Dendryphion nanum TaxID=256645 RepID=A0A9P9E523_9PLEO|nr:hypothetical protein B0J11DRAFT_259730 [Dendryphion nanum]